MLRQRQNEKWWKISSLEIKNTIELFNPDWMVLVVGKAVSASFKTDNIFNMMGMREHVNRLNSCNLIFAVKEG